MNDNDNNNNNQASQTPSPYASEFPDYWENTPHMKFWATKNSPTLSDESSPTYELFELTIVASGPDNHDEVRDIRVLFDDNEEATRLKGVIDNSFEPYCKEIS